MRAIRRVVICGAGAVGSAYAARLHDLDPGLVAFAATGDRRARLLREGVTVNGRPLRVPCLDPAQAGAPADLLLVAVKHHHLEAAIEEVRPLVGDDTVVVSVLNGISSEATLARAFGADRILHAFTVGNDVVREGSHTRYRNVGKLVFGAASNDRSDPRVAALERLLARAGIPHAVPEDIVREQWWKFMLNVGVNQVSAVLRAPYGAFAEVAEVRDLTRTASLEAVAVARAEGVALGPEDVEGIFPILATLAPDGKTSMLQDVEAGRKTEVEIFAGAVVELGVRHGIPTPVNRTLGTAIAALEKLTAAGLAPRRP